MADKPTSGPANDPDIKGMIQESLNTPAEREEFIDIVNSSKAVKTTFEWLSANMENPIIKRVIESDVALFDFIANCKYQGVAETLADDYIKQRADGLTMEFGDFLKYKFSVYVKAFGGEKLFKELVKKVKSAKKIEVSSKAPVRDDEETRRVDYRTDDMPQSGRTLTVDSYNPNGDYNSEEEIPIYPNLIGSDSETIRSISLQALKEKIEAREAFVIQQKKPNKDYQVSENLLLVLEWQKRYYTARLRVVEKLKKQQQDEARARADAEAKAREEQRIKALHRIAEKSGVVSKTRHSVDEGIRKRAEQEQREREERAKAEAEAKQEEAARAARLAVEEEIRKFNEAQKRRQDEAEAGPVDDVEELDLGNDDEIIIEEPADEQVRFSSAPPPRFLTLDGTALSGMDLIDLDSVIESIKERISGIRTHLDPEQVEPQELKDLIHDLRELKAYREERVAEEAQAKAKVEEAEADIYKIDEAIRRQAEREKLAREEKAKAEERARLQQEKVEAEVREQARLAEEKTRLEAEVKDKAETEEKVAERNKVKETSENNEKPAEYRFEIREGGKVIGETTLNQKVIRIGRNKSTHLCIDNSNISREHALIEAENPNEVFIIDLGSTTGTYVNGLKIEGFNKRSPLKSGDSIRLGEDVEIAFSVIQATAAEANADDVTEVDDDDIVEETVETPTPYPKNPTEKILRIWDDFTSQPGTHIELSKLTDTYKLIVSPDSKVTVGFVIPGSTIEVMDGGQAEVLYSIGDFKDKPLTILLHKRKKGQVQPVIFGDLAGNIDHVIKLID